MYLKLLFCETDIATRPFRGINNSMPKIQIRYIHQKFLSEQVFKSQALPLVNEGNPLGFFVFNIYYILASNNVQSPKNVTQFCTIPYIRIILFDHLPMTGLCCRVHAFLGSYPLFSPTTDNSGANHWVINPYGLKNLPLWG